MKFFSSVDSFKLFIYSRCDCYIMLIDTQFALEDDFTFLNF